MSGQTQTTLADSGKALPTGMINKDLSAHARDELSDISDIIFFVGEAVGNVINPEELSPRACTGVFTILMMAHDRLAALMTEGGAA